MQFTELYLNNHYRLRFDFINSFPFGMGILLIDEDGEETVKYVYDLMDDPKTEISMVLCTINKVFSDEGINGPDDEETGSIRAFIEIQSANCREEWKKTFELEL